MVNFIGAGIGIMSSATRNAGIQLAPRQSANIAAIRSLSLQLGLIITIAISTAIIGKSNFPGKTQTYIFIGLALFLLLSSFFVVKVPESNEKD